MFKINFNYDLEAKKLYKYKKILIEVANCVYSELKLNKTLYFDCSFVNLQQITYINNQYRNKNYPTDVISFALNEYDNNINLIGELYICYEKIVEQAKQYHHSFKREICFLFLHGLLHLLGFDHMTVEDELIMFNLQDKILSKLNIKR